MKKQLLFIFVFALVLTACHDDVKSFKVSVHLINGNEKTVYLQKFMGNEAVIIDSAVINDDKAELTAPIDDPQLLYALKLKGKYRPMLFFADNKDVVLSGDVSDLQNVKIMASESQRELDAYYGQLNTYNAQISQNNNAKDLALKNENYSLADSLSLLNDSLAMVIKNFKTGYFNSHPRSFVAHYLLDQMKQDYTLDQLKGIVAGFSSESVYLNRIKDYMAKIECLEIGQPFVDFTLKTNEGQKISLAEIIAQNKVTLVDFWASWCTPCREENPVIKAAYTKFHELGFEVVGVSLDQSEDAWLQAIKEDKLAWTQLRDSENKVREKYLIYSIPSNFLYDQHGTMIAKGLRGEDLAVKLNELLK